MPACWHALAKDPEHRSEVLTKRSLTTVEAMFSVVTHTGVRSTEGTWLFAVLSAVCPFTRPEGGVWPARRYRASATAAWASR